MKISPKIIVYAIAILALVIGFMAYGSIEEEHDHDEHSVLAGETDKLAIVGAILAVVVIISGLYIWKRTPSEDSEENV